MDFVMKQALGGEALALHPFSPPPHPLPTPNPGASVPRASLCQPCHHDAALFLPQPSPTGATKDMGKMLGGEEEKDPDAQKKEEERQEALRQQEEERKAKHARMEAEREKVRQQIRDKVSAALSHH